MNGQRIPPHWFGMASGLNLDGRFWMRVADWVRKTGVNDLDGAPDDVVRTAIAAQEGNAASQRLSTALHRGFERPLRPGEQFGVRRAPVPPQPRVINGGRIEPADRPVRIPAIPRHLRARTPEKA